MRWTQWLTVGVVAFEGQKQDFSVITATLGPIRPCHEREEHR